jgi:hypothetical protein
MAEDPKLLLIIKGIPQQAQRQYSADEQLHLLVLAANRLGLYDAADAIQKNLKRP